MIERHTFKELIENVVTSDALLSKLEKLLGVQFDSGIVTNSIERTIHAIAEGFQPYGEINDFQVETINELLYHFIYMEDCGNESEHCKSKLVIINEGKEDQHSVPCTNLDELYNVIILYLENTDCDFTFNYCHATQEDEELKDAR